MKVEEIKADVIWHYENVDYAVPYCRKVDLWWQGYSISMDARGQDITSNPKFVTCVKCLKKMKKEGVKNIFSKKEIEILQKVSTKNHIMPDSIETLITCRKLAKTGHLSEVIGFKNEILFYVTVQGNSSLKAILEVYGDEYK